MGNKGIRSVQGDLHEHEENLVAAETELFVAMRKLTLAREAIERGLPVDEGKIDEEVSRDLAERRAYRDRGGKHHHAEFDDSLRFDEVVHELDDTADEYREAASERRARFEQLVRGASGASASSGSADSR